MTHLRSSLAIVLGLFATASLLGAQVVRDNGTDIHLHKFQPPVAPEVASKPAPGQDANAFAALQIVAMEQEKGMRTAVQRKIDSNLLYTMRMMSGQSAAPGIPVVYTGIDLDEKGRMVVDITANVTDALLEKLNASGALVQYSNADFRSIRAIVPPSQLENIAASQDVIFIGPKVGSATAGIWSGFKASPLLKPGFRPGFAQRAARIRRQLTALLQSGTPITGSGSVDTEGDLAHRAADARGVFGVNGAGLKIGVLSDSANATGTVPAAQLTGDLPPNCPGPGGPCLTIVQDDPSGSDEGSAMMEIIYDLAPGASLFFATADVSESGFAQNILNLQSVSHCDIIVDDVFYFDEPVFQDGIVAQAVSTVTTAGALYFSSAGNEGDIDNNTAGYFEGDFNDTGSPAFTFPGGTKTGTIHNFGTVGSPINGDIITSSGEAYTLNWSDAQGASGNDYDLFVVSSAGTVKAQSTNVQSGTQNPFEQITPPALAAGDRLVVFKTAAAAVRAFAINTIRGTLTEVTNGQTHGHSAALGTGIFSVAATPAAGAFNGVAPVGPFPGPFTTSDSVEPFTSDGPRRVFYNANGTAITPGNFLFGTAGGALRSKPDVTGADGVSTTLPGNSGLNPFYGTSAAAPHAAAIAALLKSANPALTQAQIRTALTSTAVVPAAGGANDYGAGIVMAFQALGTVATGGANPELGTITAAENPGNGNGILEAGEGGKLTIQLTNAIGVQAASNITATLTSSTTGVTITQPATSSYANIGIASVGGNNLSPFTFTLASNLACGAVLNFTLTLSYNGGTTRALPFTVQSGMVTFSNTLGTTPTAIPGVTTATGTQTGRISRNGVPSVCGTAKTNPGLTTAVGSRVFDSYTFTACKAACLTPVMNSSNGINLYELAYSPTFDPTNPATDFAADAGASSSTQTFGLTTTASTQYTIVVHDINVTPGSGSHYTLQFPSCALNCNVNQVPNAVVHNVTVTAATVGGTAPASINNGSNDPDDATNTLTITQTPPGPYPVGTTTVTLTVTDPKGASAQATATVTVVNPDFFTLAATIPSVTVTAGSTATDHITVTPTPATGNTLTFSCSGLPALTACSFTPPTVPPGTAPTDVVISITTTKAITKLEGPRTYYAMWLPFTGIGLMGIVLMGARKRNRKAAAGLGSLVLMAMLLTLTSCGSSKPTPMPGTPPGTSTITVTATSTAQTKSATFTLVVQ
jgi:Subtilase family